jgi:ankyrin repeat protein
MMRQTQILVVLFALLVALSACRMSPKAAREKLAQQNISFSEGEFFKKIEDGDASVVELFLIAGANANAVTEPSFGITGQVLEDMRAKSVPDDVLKKMESLKDQKITGEDRFLSVLKSTIGDEATSKFQPIILPYARTDNGQTALMAAARKGNTAIVKALLDAKADANGKNKVGETALLVAAFNGHGDTVKTLLNAKPNVNAKDENGITALMAAAHKGHAAVVQSLLDGGVDANAKDNKGETALMQAAEQDHDDAVKALLAHSADAQIRNGAGSTALIKAYLKGHTDVVRSLLASLTNGNPATGAANASIFGAKAHAFAADGFLDGTVEIPRGKVVLTIETTGDISVDQIAILKMDWEQVNTSHYQQGFKVLESGNVRFYSQLMGVTAKLTPMKLEVLLRDGQVLVVELEKVKAGELEFVTQVDGQAVRLELPLKTFEVDYTNEDSRRLLTLEGPLPRKDKGWKVKHVIIDFT